MKSIIKKIMYILALIIQVGTIAGVFIIQYLTKKKAGVMHHIYYRKYQFESSIFSTENLLIQKNIAIIISLIFLLIMIYILKNKKNKFYKIQAVLTFVSSLLVYIVITSSYFTEKLAYHYFIMAFALVCIIQMIVFIVNIVISKSIKNN